MLPVPTFVVLSMPHPLERARDVFAMGQGCSIEDAMLEAAYRAELPVDRFSEAVAILDDTKIDKERWSIVRPYPGQHLIIKLVPGDPISITALVTSIAAYAAPGALALTAGSAAAIAVSVGITLVGALIQMALAPAPRQSNSAPDRKEAAVYSVQGVSNQAKPYGTIPRIFGRVVNYYPPLAAAPYTELGGGNHQYLRIVFCFGYGPLQLSAMKIGTTPLGNFENVTYEVRQGYPDDEPLTLFPAQVREQQLNIQLRQVNGYSERRSEPDTDEISIDVVFPGGLQRISNRNIKFSLEVEFEIQYKAAASATWLPATLTTDLKNVSMNGAGRFTVRGYTKATLRRTVRVELPARGRYDVKIRRLTTDDQADNEGKDQSVTIEDSYWSSFRSHRNEHPVNKTGLAFVALRIRASDQLNGVLDQFNCTVESILPVWNGSTWSEAVSRSPAWGYCEVLRGEANDRAVADSRVNLDDMLAFDSYCTEQGITFDGVFEDRNSVYQVLSDIAGTADASPSFGQGPLTVVIDNERDTVVQHLTPRNSKNFSSTKNFTRRPHALKVRFPNERTLRQFDEIYVYDTGYSAANASLFETLELPYTSTARQARRRARRAQVAVRLRPDIHSVEMDVEHIACTRGDLVLGFHDVPLWGVGSARVRALVTSGLNTTGVTLDAPLTMGAGIDYALYFRVGATGDTQTIAVNTVAGTTDDFTFQVPVLTADGPAVGDLVSLGEGVYLIVRSIEPMSDLAARVTLVDYSPEIFTSTSGTLPEDDPQITLPPASNRDLPAKPSITSIDSSEAVLARASDGTLTSRILLGFTVNNAEAYVTAEALQVRYRVAATDTDFTWLPTVPLPASSIYIGPVDDAETYEIELRSVFAGVPSEWTAIEHTVIGKTTPPPDVDRMYRRGDLLVWPYPDPPIDHAGFVVRAQFGTSQDWGTARALHQGVLTASSIDISDLDGTQTVMVKAIDTSGIEAITAASVTLNLGDVAVSNVILTQSEAPTFGGTITGGTVSGGLLEADVVASPAFWGADEAAFWGADSEPFWRDTEFAEMTYVARWTPTSDQLGDGILKLSLDVTGDYTVDFRIATSPAFWGADGDPFWGADADPFWAEDEVGEFTPWPGLLGPFDTVDNTYEIRVTVRGGAVQGVITTMDLLCDVPDIVESFEDFVTAVTTGTRLTLTKTYRGIKTIQITRQDDGGTAVRVDYFDKQANPGAAGGPLIKGLSAAAAVVASTSSIEIKGY